MPVFSNHSPLSSRRLWYTTQLELRHGTERRQAASKAWRSKKLFYDRAKYSRPVIGRLKKRKDCIFDICFFFPLLFHFTCTGCESKGKSQKATLAPTLKT